MKARTGDSFLRRLALLVLLAGVCALTPGCKFLADEFWYVDRAAPTRQAGEEGLFAQQLPPPCDCGAAADAEAIATR